MNPDRLTTRDDFEYWLADMDDGLDRFVGALPAEVRAQLDFSPRSLDIVEAWILQTYADTDAMLAPGEAQRVNGVACYVGEVFRKATDGRWDIELDDPRDVYFGLPVLVSKEPDHPICPHTLATASADRRTGSYLRTVLTNRVGSV